VLLSAYVFRRWLGPLLWTTLAIGAILLLEALYGNVPDLLHRGAPLPLILAHHALQIPGQLPIVLPISVFVSALFAIGKLQGDGEIIAMRAAGLSIWQITRLLWLGTLAISLSLSQAQRTLIPMATARARLILGPFGSASGESRGPVTYAGGSGRLWLVERLDWTAGTAENLHIYENGTNGLRRRIWAGSANYRDGLWTLGDVREWDEEAIFSSQQPPHRKLKEYPHLKETPLLLHLSRQKLHGLSPDDLRLILGHMDRDDPARIPYALRLHALLADCWSPPIALLCALPFSLARSRRNPFIAVSKAIACLFSFHLLGAACHLLATANHLRPATAAYLPFAIASVGGILLLRRKF
jgi:lipopolysaccharide export system permease protein